MQTATLHSTAKSLSSTRSSRFCWSRFWAALRNSLGAVSY
jgi:hypothetical protein